MAEWAFLIPCLISRLYRVLNFTFLSLLSIPTYFMSMTKKLDCQFCFYQHLSSHMIIYIIMGTWKPPFAFTDHPVYLPTITEERSMLLLGVQHVQQCLVRYFSTFELSSYWNYYCSVFMFFYYYISIYIFMLSEEENETLFVIYSVGDGIILSHDPKKFQNEAQDINSVIFKMNGPKVWSVTDSRTKK